MFAEGLNIFSRSIPDSFVGKNLKESNIREKTGCSVIAIKLSGNLFVGPDLLNLLNSQVELILMFITEAEQVFLDLL